ncbi:ANR family transcriptional regulator [Aeromonas rivuli]|uniref:ANR family transcriptional regulator n=1 Tax=Aeromonas rivuli TaxID=648794 RepID=UPI0005AA9734|nr:ANR family transcriptional regulator [Aeromonas rivuli]
MGIQDIQFNREGLNSYHKLASRAVTLEQQGVWSLAAETWGAAKKAAHKEMNQAWAQARIEFCLNAATRNWKAAA